MDDESDKISRLEDRIEQLEATTKKMMPTRRDALKFGGAAAIGAAAMSGTASAGSNQVGTIGDASNLVDIEAEDVTINDTLNGASISGAAQDEALLSDGAGGLTFAEAGGGVPPNFSYQDVSGRSFDTTFTNNTGKALWVNVNAGVSGGFGFSEVGYRSKVDGDVIQYKRISLSNGNLETNSYLNVNFFVPDGSTYEVEDLFDTFFLSAWIEAEM